MDEFEALASSPEFNAKLITINTLPGTREVALPRDLEAHHLASCSRLRNGGGILEERRLAVQSFCANQ